MPRSMTKKRCARLSISILQHFTIQTRLYVLLDASSGVSLCLFTTAIANCWDFFLSVMGSSKYF